MKKNKPIAKEKKVKRFHQISSSPNVHAYKKSAILFIMNPYTAERGDVLMMREWS